MTDTTSSEHEIDRVECYDPDILEYDSESHIRSTPADPSPALIRSIREMDGVVIPIHARRVDGDLHVFDGWRRVQACRELGKEVPTLVYTDLSMSEALAKSLTLNDEKAGVENTVSDDDRERSMMALVTGERRTRNPWERDTGEIDEARYRLGLDSEVDLLGNKIGGVDGVGQATLSKLVDHFGDAEAVLAAGSEALQAVHGVGPQTATRIRECVERDTPEVITHAE